jgi:hypothetical protein
MLPKVLCHETQSGATWITFETEVCVAGPLGSQQPKGDRAVGVRKGLEASCMQKAKHTCNCFEFGCPEGFLEMGLVRWEMDTETESLRRTPQIKTNAGVSHRFLRGGCSFVCDISFALMWHMSLEPLQRCATGWTTLSCN